jgi:hypothetical protein
MARTLLRDYCGGLTGASWHTHDEDSTKEILQNPVDSQEISTNIDTLQLDSLAITIVWR